MSFELSIYHQVTVIDERFKYEVVRNKKVSDNLILYDKKEVEEHKNSLILGYVTHNKYEREIDADKQHLSIGDEYLLITKNKKGMSKIKGYLEVDENVFVGYTKKTFIIPLILTLFILLLCVCGIVAYTMPDDEKPKLIKELADTIDSDGVVDNNDLYIDTTGYLEFAGYSFLYATKDEPTVLLENPESNDVYFTYKVISEETGEVILDETGYIEPGKALPWDVYSCLEQGEHQVTFHIRTFDIVDPSIEFTPTVMENITIKIY